MDGWPAYFLGAAVHASELGLLPWWSQLGTWSISLYLVSVFELDWCLLTICSALVVASTGTHF